MFKKLPHTYTIICFIILVCAMLSWIIPAGEFQRETIQVGESARTVIVQDSYHEVEPVPHSWQIFTSFIYGFEKQAGIIAFLLIIGGAFQVMNESKAINNGIISFLNQSKQLNKYRFMQRIGVNNLIIASVVVLFSLFGAVFGMSEETLAFVVLIVPLAVSMGYDSLTGITMVYVAAHVGFSAAMLNPFTIGIAQGLANIPLFSGIEYRIFCWITFTGILIAGLLYYASRVKVNPTQSLTYKIDEHWRSECAAVEVVEYDGMTRAAMSVYIGIGLVLTVFSFYYPVSSISIGQSSFHLSIIPILTALYMLLGWITVRKSDQLFVLVILLFTILFLIVGVMGYGWYIPEIGALFLAMGLVAGYTMGYDNNTIIAAFLTGAKDMLSAALVVALAGGIIQVLQDGRIIDTILHGLAQLMANTGNIIAIGVMYLIQTVINVIIPSGSAKAALTMPIMAPFSDVIGISRQATVMAFQLGDGITNMITPSSGVLMGALGIARIPYEIWVKWFWKAILFFVILGFVLLIPTVTIQLNGF
ncbi:MAG: YfcC family protein [Marinifilaceae bacterium]